MNATKRMRNTMALSSLLLSIILGGCEVGPDYTAPKTDLVQFHNLGDAEAKDGKPTVQLESWWTGFNDPLLVKLVDRALKQNLDLTVALARVDQARAGAEGAGAELLPTVDLGASVGYSHQSLKSASGSVSHEASGFQRDAWDKAVGPVASWEVDLFGGLRRGAAAAANDAEAAQAEEAGTRIIVAADTADAYMQVRGYQARLAVADSQVKIDQQLLDLIHDRADSGAATQLEVAQAEALLKDAKASIPPLRLDLERQLNRLDVLLGAQPGTYAHELDVVQEIPAVPAFSGDEQASDILRRRPDIIAAERDLAASSERIGEAISDWYPKISVSGALGLDSISASHFFSPAAFGALGSGALRWRIFDFGKVESEIALAKGANAEALAAYQKTVLEACEDVENALASLVQTQIHISELQGQVESLTRVQQLSQQAYKAGSITLTDVLDANRQLLTAEDELDANRADAARASVAVFRAFGGGWDSGVSTVASN